eukprot:1000618-Pleurochrysis_carterae.AAC.3
MAYSSKTRAVGTWAGWHEWTAARETSDDEAWSRSGTKLRTTRLWRVHGRKGACSSSVQLRKTIKGEIARGWMCATSQLDSRSAASADSLI